MLAMAADTGNSEPLCCLWWLSHFVQDKFQSTNSEDKFKHIQYMSKNTHTRKTYPQHILQTHRKHIQNIKSKQKHIFKRFTVLPEQPVAAVF